MKITEALEKGNGYAHRHGFVAVFLDGNDVVRWDATGQPPVALNYIVLDDWLPGKPEPEKCEACEEADKLHPVVPEGGCFLTEKKAEVFMSDHLRKHHCQCKKEAP